MSSKQLFLLKKWYFDVVGTDGRSLICYSAKLTWKSIKIGYVSALYLRAPGDSHCESRFGNAAAPEIQGQTIRWEDAGLGVKGVWESAAPPVRLMVHESEEGYLDWNCLQPAARCHIQLKEEPPLEGWGYVECIEMTIPPWKIGMEELRWGRFAHPGSPLVWIELRGTPHRCWVFDGQEKVLSAAVSDEVIDLPEQEKRLLLSHPAVIEDKHKIMETVASLVRWMPGFEQFTPLHFLNSKGTKWRSEGTLTMPGHEDRRGWVIHEVVTF